MPTISKKRLDKSYSSKVQSCKARKIKFSLSKEEYRILMEQDYCAYTNIKMTLTQPGQRHQNATDLTIERVDCDLPYTMDNCIAVCHAANQAKGVFDSMLRSNGLELLKQMSHAINKIEPAKEYTFIQKCVLKINRMVGL